MAETLEEFLARVASEAPTPAGGAVAALTVAASAALVAMVGRVTLAREPGAAEVARETVETADRLRLTATELGIEDSAAYTRLLEARRQGLAERSAAVATALRRATDVPLAITRAARNVLAAAARLTEVARVSTLSDLSVATALAWAALEAGAVTARSNLAVSEDEGYARDGLTELARLIDEGAALRRRSLALVEERL